MISIIAQITDPNAADVTINQGATLYRITDFGLLLTRLFNVAILLIGIVILAYILWGGVDWVLSGGDKGKVEAARSKITQGIVGLALFVSIFAIYFVLKNFLGLGNHLNITGQPSTNNGQCWSCQGDVCPDGWPYGPDTCSWQSCEQRAIEACRYHQ